MSSIDDRPEEEVVIAAVSTPAAKPFPKWIGRSLRIALGLGGLVVLGVIIEREGYEKILETLGPALVWMPVLCLIELGRMGSEAVCAYFALGTVGPKVPKLSLFRASIIGQGISNLAPAPRVVNETIKATLLARYVGGPAVASAGLVNQAATLMAVGLATIPCAIAIYLLIGFSFLFWATVIHSVVLVGAGLGIRALTRDGRPVRLLARRFPRLQPLVGGFRDRSGDVGLFAAKPTSALMVSRVLQVAQYWIAARAVGIKMNLISALAAEAVNLVSNAVGVLVPAGVGTTESAFTLAADMLKTTDVQATTLALLMRCMQLVWLSIGSVMLFLTPSAPKEKS